MGSKKGVMLVGVCGHLSTTAMAGSMAVAKKICPATGMISETKNFKHVPFTNLSNFVFGGWDIRPYYDSRQALKDIHFDNIDKLDEISKKLETIQSESFPGIILNAGDAICDISDQHHIFKTDKISEGIEKVRKDIEDFKQDNDVEKIIVINLSSTEPPIPDLQVLSSMPSMEELIAGNHIDRIRPSFIYAYAAITSGCAYINFTPSEGGLSQGLVDLAKKHCVPVMGSDGKTGETLIKSALAPMFAMRNLEVLSWEGYNILGNMDGKILQNSENGSSKIKSKDRLLPHILGYDPHSRVSIDYVPSLGDRKTAWDFIHFQGFLNTKMNLQFTWQGCDSALAAPLVLDLARFGFLAMEKGESGIMTHMASFFKSPWNIDEHSLEKQFSLLENYCRE
jgi:myo-inositol-1-phosphate synthase